MATSTTFLGLELWFDGRRRLPQANVARAAERLRLARQGHAQGQLDEAAVRQSVGAWVAHARHADTFALRRQWFPGGWFSPLGEAERAR